MFIALVSIFGLFCLASIADDIRAIRKKLESGDIFTRPINSYGEGIGDAIQGQLVRGMKGIDQYEHR